MRRVDLAPAFAARIREVAAQHPVVLVYLFGSHARGTADAESDLDLAVLADPALPKHARQELRLALMPAFAEALAAPLDKIEVIVLQDAPVLLQYNAIRRGRLLFTRDAASRRAFELAVERRYEDESPLLDQEADLTVARILSRRA